MTVALTAVPKWQGGLLGCVWSDLSGGCSCKASLPEEVVAEAWQRELDTSGDGEARFFHFIWQGGVWLAYGLRSGRVRGVYCPAHNSERAERSHAALRDRGDIAHELPLAA
jgi:hypothetical protein